MVGSVYFLTIILLAVKMFHSETHIGRSWQHGNGRLGWYMMLGLVVNFGLWLNVAISDPGFLPAGQVGDASAVLLGTRLLADRSTNSRQPFLVCCTTHCNFSCCQLKLERQLGPVQSSSRASVLMLHDALGFVAANNQQSVLQWAAAAS